MIHSTLALDGQGVAVGLADQKIWVRDPDQVGQRHTRRQRDISPKVSRRWMDALRVCQQRIPESVRLLTVADREADIYDLFVSPRRSGVDLLIRAEHNRAVNQEQEYLCPTVRGFALGGEITVQVPRRPDRAARQARLRIRYGKVKIQRPRNRRAEALPAELELYAVLAEEIDPPKGEAWICWLLLTSLAVSNLEMAGQCVQWYCWRWLVERYHYVMKSGCRVEQLQLATGQRLMRALATYALVAWRILWMTYEARVHPQDSCEKIVQELQWKVLYVKVQKTTQLPATPPTVHEVVRWIAQLRGFLGRKHDGEPGVKTLWRGLRQLATMVSAWDSLRRVLPARLRSG